MAIHFLPFIMQSYLNIYDPGQVYSVKCMSMTIAYGLQYIFTKIKLYATKYPT